MAVGLFTLNSATLGVLDTNVIGGAGTGYVIGSSSSSATVTGQREAQGSVSASQTSNASLTGTAQRFGLISSASLSSGSVTGTEQDVGVVRGVSTSSGSVTGVGPARTSGGGSRIKIAKFYPHSIKQAPSIKQIEKPTIETIEIIEQIEHSGSALGSVTSSARLIGVTATTGAIRSRINSDGAAAGSALLHVEPIVLRQRNEYEELVFLGVL